MKKKTAILWGAFVVCLIMTVVLWFAVDASKPEFEEVQAKVLSAVTKQVVNRKNGNTYNFYEVKVEYEGETYDLENAHNTYSYPKGKVVKAYFSGGRLFANKEGVKTATPLATVYFVFLFGSLIMLFVAAVYSGKLSQQKKAQTKTIPGEADQIGSSREDREQ